MSEDDPIIAIAQELWREADTDLQTDRDIIATVATKFGTVVQTGTGSMWYRPS